MTLRDIKEILDLINFRIKNGLELDSSICIDFEKKIKHKNYLFSQGIDFFMNFLNLKVKLIIIFKANNKIFGKKINQ